VICPHGCRITLAFASANNRRERLWWFNLVGCSIMRHHMMAQSLDPCSLFASWVFSKGGAPQTTQSLCFAIHLCPSIFDSLGKQGRDTRMGKDDFLDHRSKHKRKSARFSFRIDQSTSDCHASRSHTDYGAPIFCERLGGIPPPLYASPCCQHGGRQLSGST
jgi:hypothetical protein